MMLDPILRLALAIHSSKGFYALLLGSGVSRSSPIPTGWEIVLDLIRKLAALKGESCDPDPEAWYKALTGSDPDYSDILDQITLSSAERGQLLRSYFEPLEEDREHGRKAPSPAHRAIAALIAKGCIRVIVTTNFDRLMEQALVDAGVQPTVISTTDAVKGALPLTHSPCTVIKIHGDYRDSRLRNTRPELSAYEKPFDDLLDRVFDEFGLVICGWSAEWDVALRAALERCPTHRFGTYWTARGELTGEAEKVISVRRATVVPIKDADSFFNDLAEKIRALEDLTLSDPVSAKVAVARMKRYLASAEARISLYDFVAAETERVHAGIWSDRFLNTGEAISAESTLRLLRAFENEMHILLPMLACGGHWASGAQSDVLRRAVKRLGEDSKDRGARYGGINLQRYPAMLALYSIGLAAIANKNYGVLKQVLLLKIRDDSRSPEQPATELLSPLRVLDLRYQRELLPGREREFTPLNNYIFEYLRDLLREYLPDDRAYEEAFDWLEYLVGLVHADLTVTPEDLEKIKADPPVGHFWGPVGRFLWNRRGSEDGVVTRAKFDAGGPYPEIVTSALGAGMFGSNGGNLNFERFRLLKRGFDALVVIARNELGVW